MKIIKIFNTKEKSYPVVVGNNTSLYSYFHSMYIQIEVYSGIFFKLIEDKNSVNYKHIDVKMYAL